MELAIPESTFVFVIWVVNIISCAFAVSFSLLVQFPSVSADCLIIIDA